ncbi:hypothetical protein HMPREF1551_01097 [Capnocytophaga sp. oral taxon 863 str. F0517]|nr:hypothetical protein HMPREF1551_01097 [Capnocytophaga sp. oral taxon 863 str. F0517]
MYFYTKIFTLYFSIGKQKHNLLIINNLFNFIAYDHPGNFHHD